LLLSLQSFQFSRDDVVWLSLSVRLAISKRDPQLFLEKQSRRIYPDESRAESGSNGPAA
jgi:hypothetical protein